MMTTDNGGVSLVFLLHETDKYKKKNNSNKPFGILIGVTIFATFWSIVVFFARGNFTLLLVF